MVGGLKIVQVKPGREAELERLFAGLRAEIAIVGVEVTRLISKKIRDS
jgi:hypothetical protein